RRPVFDQALSHSGRGGRRQGSVGRNVADMQFPLRVYTAYREGQTFLWSGTISFGARCGPSRWNQDVPQWYVLMTPDEVSLHQAERKRLSSSYKQLLNDVSAILFRHDPIGINFEDNTDEYDPEAGTILPRLRRDLSVEQMTAIVHEEFVRWFEPETA